MTDAGEDAEKGEPPAPLVQMQAGAATLENSMVFPQKVEARATLRPSFALLSIYLKDTNVVIQRGMCTPVFIAAMFKIAKLWKEPRCPLTNEWIKMWCV